MPSPHRGLVCSEFQKGPRYANWRPLGSGDWLLIYTAKGSGAYSSTSETLATRVGDAILYAPGEEQRYGTAGRDWRLLWAHFPARPAWDPWLAWPRASNGVRMITLPSGEIRRSFVAAMKRMISLSRRNLPGSADIARNALEEALLWAHSGASGDPWFRVDSRLRRAADSLTADLRAPFRLENTARGAGLSVSRFEHLFKQAMACTPQQYLERHRMDHAQSLLRVTSLSIGEIASEVGYEDAFYFTNRFRRYTGQSPSAFRQKMMEGRG